MLRTVAALIQSFLLTPIRALFNGEHTEKDAAYPVLAVRKKRRVNAKTIQISPCAAREMTEDGRAIYASCDAIVDGVAYKFDLVHQSGTLDAIGRQERPCWSWIRVQGPHRTTTSTMIEAMFACVPPYQALSSDLLRTRAVRQAIEQWRKMPEVRDAGASAHKEEDKFGSLLVREGQRRKAQSSVPRSAA
jgi:hypothetical protein